MIPFIEVTDASGNPGYMKAGCIEATLQEPDTGVTRLFVSTGGYYRVKDTQSEILAKLRDIDALMALEEKE